MIWPALTVWHLSALLALWLYVKLPRQRSSMLTGGLVTLPILFLLPILSHGYFGAIEAAKILQLFISQGVIVFSLGMVTSAVYEELLRPKVTVQAKPPRRHFVVFTAGLVLSLVLFDVFSQPLMPSIIFGLGLNALLAFRFYAQELNDILFASLVMAGFYLFIYTAILFDLPGDAGRFWFDSDLIGVTIFGLAVEKAVAIFSFGAFWGPIYVGIKDVLAAKS